MINMSPNRIQIAYKSGLKLKISDLNEFQDELKELSDENRAKLRFQIETTGFAYAPHVWRNPNDQKYYLIDGHQRISVLKDLISEGFECENIPVIEIDAANIDEAKMRVLQSVSQFGTVTNQGLYEFISQIDNVDFTTELANFDIPGIDANDFLKAYLKPITETLDDEEKKSTEVEQGQFSKLVHTCPKCGFSFGAE